ncbi:MAG: sulfite exporter TauE/SafE family protein [Erysipelotrichaceae bacterium]|nr:sulfite exporter TauE/SafE family protein [Erysipelotrichaceae bacterium]
MLSIIFCSAIVAGIVNGLTGFGAGIVMMLFFPNFLSIIQAPALSSAISLVLNGEVTWQYRKYCEPKKILYPSVLFIAVSSAVISYAKYIPKEIVLKVFGIFLIALAVYFLIFDKNVSIEGNMITATVCTALSGVASGLFGIGGPPMVLYFLAICKEKEEYLGNIQAFFMLTGVANLIVRLLNGIYTMDLLPLVAVGVGGIMVGKKIADTLLKDIPVETMKKLIYLFLALSGILNLI